jgi:hypothetical protein
MSENEGKNKSELVMDEMSPISPALSRSLVTPASEYKVGHNKPPLFLIVLYVMVILWCAISWIPFYGY